MTGGGTGRHLPIPTPQWEKKHGVRTYGKKLRRKLSDDTARPRYSFNEFRFERLPLPRWQDPTGQGAVEGHSIG